MASGENRQQLLDVDRLEFLVMLLVVVVDVLFALETFSLLVEVRTARFHQLGDQQDQLSDADITQIALSTNGRWLRDRRRRRRRRATRCCCCSCGGRGVVGGRRGLIVLDGEFIHGVHQRPFRRRGR